MNSQIVAIFWLGYIGGDFNMKVALDKNSLGFARQWPFKYSETFYFF